MKCAFLLHVVCMSMHCIAFDVHALHSQPALHSDTFTVAGCEPSITLHLYAFLNGHIRCIRCRYRMWLNAIRIQYHVKRLNVARCIRLMNA